MECSLTSGFAHIKAADGESKPDRPELSLRHEPWLCMAGLPTYGLSPVCRLRICPGAPRVAAEFAQDVLGLELGVGVPAGAVASFFVPSPVRVRTGFPVPV